MFSVRSGRGLHSGVTPRGWSPPRTALEESAMATGRVLKKLFAMSALAGALLIAAPVEARDRDHGRPLGYSHHDRHGGHGWGGHHRYRHHDGHHGGHHGRHWRHHGGHYGHGGGWGYYAPRHYAPPRYYHHYHRHHRGCGHVGYHDDGALIHFLVDYARYD